MIQSSPGSGHYSLHIRCSRPSTQNSAQASAFSTEAVRTTPSLAIKGSVSRSITTRLHFPSRWDVPAPDAMRGDTPACLILRPAQSGRDPDSEYRYPPVSQNMAASRHTCNACDPTRTFGLLGFRHPQHSNVDSAVCRQCARGRTRNTRYIGFAHRTDLRGGGPH
jgi:hypothetical protein